jgi:hypothetical protein
LDLSPNAVENTPRLSNDNSSWARKISQAPRLLRVVIVGVPAVNQNHHIKDHA